MLSVTYFVFLGINIETMSILYGGVMWENVNDRQLFWIILLPVFHFCRRYEQTLCVLKNNQTRRKFRVYIRIDLQPTVDGVYICVCVEDDLSRLSFYYPTRVNTIKFYLFFSLKKHYVFFLAWRFLSSVYLFVLVLIVL